MAVTEDFSHQNIVKGIRDFIIFHSAFALAFFVQTLSQCLFLTLTAAPGFVAILYLLYIILILSVTYSWPVAYCLIIVQQYCKWFQMEPRRVVNPSNLFVLTTL